jgi:hypothetical protein
MSGDGHQDTRIFGQSYVGDVAPVDVRAAYRGEEAETNHVNYFQSIEQFRRTGLPIELPAVVKEQLLKDVTLHRYTQRVEVLRASDKVEEFLKTQKELQSYRARLYKTRLDQYQKEWTDKLDGEHLMTPREYWPVTAPRTDEAQLMFRFFPEREHIAKAMVTKAHLTDNELVPFMKDVVALY